MERPSEWGGMILHLYRQVDSSVYSSNTIKELTDGDIHTYKAFGNFDRLCFTPVCRFVDYMKRSENAYRWIGGHKDIMMYPVRSSNAERHFSFAQVNEKQMNLVMKPKYERRFLIMTMLFMSSEVKETLENYQGLLNKCSMHLKAMIDAFNTTLGYTEEQAVFGELYGTFNSAELCILWGADQFTDVQYLVDQIRYLSIGDTDDTAIPLFASSYTIVGLYKSIPDVLKEGPVKGGAMIQLASASLRHTASADKGETPIDYLNSLNDGAGERFTVEACSGEYDFLLNTRPPRLDLLERSTKSSPKKLRRNLHHKNNHYRTHFSSTTTRLYYDKQDVPEQLRDASWKKYRRIDATDIFKKKPAGGTAKKDELLFGKKDFNRYQKKMTRSINDVSSLGINLQLFYSDYLRTLHMTPDRQWTKDLEYQVKTAFDALESFDIRRKNKRLLKMDREYIERSEMILQSLRHQIHHITEAGKFTFEEPCLRANSTVEYDLLFHMFYGAAKEILNCIYDRNDGKAFAEQSTLVPLIQFQPKPIIESYLLFDKDGLEKRLVDITIPYDAWGEPQFFIPFLVHEFYHFAAPVDRDIRNEYFSKFLLSEIFRTALQEYLFETYDAHQTTVKGHTKKKKLQKEEKEQLVRAVANQLAGKIFEKIMDPAVVIRNMMQKDHMSGNGDSQQESLLSNVITGDAGWSVYREAFLFWCHCFCVTSAGEDNCASFFSKLLKESLAELRADGTINPYDNSAGLYDILEQAVTHDPGTADHPLAEDLIVHIQDRARFIIQRTPRGLREIFPDYAMVALCNLGVKEYLLLFATLHDKCFTTPRMFHQDEESTLRIGCILNHLLKKDLGGSMPKNATDRIRAFKKCRKDFVKLYVNYCNCCGWSDSDKKNAEPDVTKISNAWFDGFVTRLSDYYSVYGIYENLLEKIIEECFAPLCPEKKGEKLRKVSESYFNALFANDLQKLFHTSLKSIWRLQPQCNLQEMMPRNQPRSKDDRKKVRPFGGVTGTATTDLGLSCRRTNTVFLLTEAEFMQSMIQSISENLQRTHLKVFGTVMGAGGLWYRGVWNSEFGILPSALVHFLDEDQRPSNTGKWVKGKNSLGTLWEYQYRLLQKFKYRADGVGEMLNSVAYTMPDYLALMQHYKQNTCYLDWSEDAFSSLFFALERYVMRDKLNDKEDEKDASLFILDPMLYNRARKQMTEDVCRALSGNELAEQNMKLNNEPEGSIPDISLKWNLEKYSMFTMADPTFLANNVPETVFVSSDKPVDKNGTDRATLVEFPNEVLNLPLAVRTSRLNPRIRKQNGQFMVYSYLCLPAYTTDEVENPDKYVLSADRFDYLALQRIQDYYLRTVTNAEPFMYELRIRHDTKDDIASYLRSAGINRFGIYPELDNLKL